MSRTRATADGKGLGGIRAALVGCGAVALRGLIPGWLPRDHPSRPAPAPFLEFGGCSGLDIVAICDLDSRRLAEAATALPSATIFNRWEEMREGVRDKVDAIIIATPNHLHHVMAVDALEDGHDVFLEKPMAVERVGLDAVCKKARSSDRILMVDLPWRWTPTARELVVRVREHRFVGDLRRVFAEFRHPGPTAWSPEAKWYLGDQNPGGCLSDLGPHLFDLVGLFVGPLRGVRYDRLDLQECVTCELEFDTGVVARASVGWNASVPTFRIAVQGTTGTLVATLAGPQKAIHALEQSATLLMSNSGAVEVGPTAGCRQIFCASPARGGGPFAAFVEAIRTRIEPETSALAVRSIEEAILGGYCSRA